eukprot:1139902-Pelagomonas_calceolata.AAC.3
MSIQYFCLQSDECSHVFFFLLRNTWFDHGVNKSRWRGFDKAGNHQDSIRKAAEYSCLNQSAGNMMAFNNYIRIKNSIIISDMNNIGNSRCGVLYCSGGSWSLF